MSAFGGVAAASSSAIPGDALYGVKRGLENWRLDFAGSPAQRGKLLLGEASQRMTEARQLIAEQPQGHTLSPHVAAEVTKALSDMNAEGTQGRNLLQAIYQQNHSLAPLRSLASFDSDQQRQLDAIAPQLPRQADPMAGQLQRLLSGISAELAPLHLAPAGSSTPELPTAGPAPPPVPSPAPAAARSGRVRSPLRGARPPPAAAPWAAAPRATAPPTPVAVPWSAG
ncbi:hypothetical protein GXW82_36175 [Streptacidiphilus sp. 4-A2]|nr:hypothetical protein [Streptacidiphilus sp. 4-A2]